jgi:exodeoxyribonuclease VII small subunit
LLTIVTESVDAYKVCQQRIEAVEKALEKALSDSGIKGAVGAAPKDAVSATKKAAPDFPTPDDGEIPF